MERLNTKIVTGKVRLSYAHIWEPYAGKQGEDKKYSVSLIIPKTDEKTINKIKDAIENAKKNGKASKFGGKLPADLKTPLRDGDTDRRGDENYENSYFINCSCRSQPGIVDINRQRILNKGQVYSGCFALVSITMYSFSSNGNTGIAAALNNIMKIADGKPLGGKASADADFADVDISEFGDDDLLG